MKTIQKTFSNRKRLHANCTENQLCNYLVETVCCCLCQHEFITITTKFNRMGYKHTMRPISNNFAVKILLTVKR